MRRLVPGQDVVVSSKEGAIDCTVIAVAGPYVLLGAERPDEAAAVAQWAGKVSLTFLEGMVPVGFDGSAEPGRRDGELRFRQLDGQAGTERRLSVRVPVRLHAWVTHEGSILPGQTIDISAGGMRMKHPGRLPVGAAVRVRVEFPGGAMLEADAVTRHAQHQLSSLQFTQLHGMAPEALAEWAVDVLRAHLQRAA